MVDVVRVLTFERANPMYALLGHLVWSLELFLSPERNAKITFFISMKKVLLCVCARAHVLMKIGALGAAKSFRSVGYLVLFPRLTYIIRMIIDESADKFLARTNQIL